MTDRRTPLQTQWAIAKRQRVLAELTRAAEAGDKCPTNAALAEAAGYRCACSVAFALNVLVDEGLIIIERRSNSRRATINATGQKTAMSKRWRKKPVVAGRPVAEIATICARTAGLTFDDVTKPARWALYKRPRFLACHLARAEGWSYKKIGDALGGRDHSTIIHACARAEQMLDDDPLFARLHRRSLAALKGQAEVLIPFVPARLAPPPATIVAGAKWEIGDDGELCAVEAGPAPGFDPLLAALRRSYPERCAA